MVTYEDCIAFSDPEGIYLACRSRKPQTQAAADGLDAALLRHYPCNSPAAQARLVALALLADGRLDAAELDLIARQAAAGESGVSEQTFFQVLYDFCADLSRQPPPDGEYRISPAALGAMLDEINDPQVRQRTLRLMFDVIRSDGKLAHGEAKLLWNAVDAWELRLENLGRTSGAAA